MFNATQITEHIFNITGINSYALSLEKKAFLNESISCKACGDEECFNCHMYFVNEAKRWGNKFIYYCNNDLVFIATINTNNNIALLTGPIIMEETDTEIDKTQIYSTKAVTSLSEIIFSTFSLYMEDDNKISKSEILNYIYKDAEEISKVNINLKYENELEAAIIMGDKPLVREIINKIICHILLISVQDFNYLKSRTLEFIVLLSRSIIKSGVDPDEILKLNTKCIKTIDDLHNIDDLSIWLIDVVQKFMVYIEDLREVKNKNVIFKVTAFIKNNYTEKITLSDIGKHVFLSNSYLSKVFKDELGCSFTDYVNNLRIQKSKELLNTSTLSLIDISNAVGFDDQSYFTKVFKKKTGISPGKYREKRLY